MPLIWPLRRRLGVQRACGVPLFGRRPLPVQPAIVLTGVTRDGAGVALASCTVDVVRSADGMRVERLTSDGSGNYTTSPVGLGQLYQILAYKAGSPDVAGVTANTLQGA